MQSIINAMRDILGEPDFYKRLTDNSNYTWDYGAMIEYMIAGIILCIVVSSVFRIVSRLFK